MKFSIHSLLLIIILALVSCEEKTGTKPTVETSTPDQITYTTALVGGNVTAAGFTAVTDRGVYWGGTADPKSEGTKLSISLGIGAFSATIDGLTEKTKYYVQAFATNEEGTSYGAVVSFTTGGSDGSFTDPRNGTVYSYSNIGTQTWMTRNMDYLPSVSRSTMESPTEALYYVYDYEGEDLTAAKASANYTTFGVLYNWTAALTACPAGWHLPGDAEWKTLELYLGMEQADIDTEGARASGQVGDKMKSHTGWPEGGNGSNSSGFAALPGGFTFPSGGFGNSTHQAQFWSSTENEDLSLSWTRRLNWSGVGIDRVASTRSRGYSVRCLKD